MIYNPVHSSLCYFVTAFPGEDFGSTIDYARQIINYLGNSGQTLPGYHGKLYFLYTGNMPLTTIYWEVDNAIWYKLDWRGDPNDAIKIMQSIVCVDDSDVK